MNNEIEPLQIPGKNVKMTLLMKVWSISDTVDLTATIGDLTIDAEIMRSYDLDDHIAEKNGASWPDEPYNLQIGDKIKVELI